MRPDPAAARPGGSAAPLVLLLHGLGGLWWSLRRQVEALAGAGFHAVAVDLRGHGDSDKPPRGYDAWTLASDVTNLIRALGHSEAIVTESRTAADRFVAEVDAAAVLVNASTRFTDGGEFGFGAEIGISTQKLHARGPMGLPEMTSTKYVVTGDGHVR